MKQILCENQEILGWDCDGNEINEFRILRFPFSENIEDWAEEYNIDPRFYCLVKSFDGNVYAVSVYDDWASDVIRRYENLGTNDDIPILIKPVLEMENYSVAFSGITEEEWYYDRDRDELLRKVESALEQKKLVKK